MNPARTLRPGSPEWPGQLDDLGRERPERLWVSGAADLRLLMLRSVAVVGCRDASSYGRAVAHDLAGGLAAAGWVVVSGAAFGIDAAAHRGALAAGGCTVAVLPGGVDVPVPRAHESLLAEVVGNGLIVSENDPGTEPRRHMFLVRNRLISALTRGVVVVEADLRSGALNTARRSEELGRIVMAAPGPVTGHQSRGTHRLIRNRRAELVTGAGDVIELLEPLGAAAPAAMTGTAGTDTPGGPGRARRQRRYPDQVILSRLTHEPRPVEQVSTAVGLEVTEVLSSLERLRSDGLADLTIQGWCLGRLRQPMLSLSPDPPARDR